MASFSVVSYLREPREIVERFARYYAHLGARQIILFFDGPCEGHDIEAIPGLQITACDAAFWADHGGKPAALEDAQSIAFSEGHRLCTADWLLVVDADEYVFGDVSVEDFLDAVPREVQAVRIPTAEAVWTERTDDVDRPFSSIGFRLATRRNHPIFNRLMFASAAPAVRRGLVGHAQGKYFVRRGVAVDSLRNHRAIHDGQALQIDAADVWPPLPAMFLGHFDALSLSRWRRKWKSRLSGTTNAAHMSRARRAHARLAHDALEGGQRAEIRLFRQLYCVAPVRWALLRRLGLGFSRDIFAPLHARE